MVLLKKIRERGTYKELKNFLQLKSVLKLITLFYEDKIQLSKDNIAIR